jgi:hypothetical protein
MGCCERDEMGGKNGLIDLSRNRGERSECSARLLEEFGREWMSGIGNWVERRVGRSWMAELGGGREVIDTPGIKIICSQITTNISLPLV